MLNVFITIDTECYPRTPDWRQSGLRGEVDREIFGITEEGEYGVRYQAEVLSSYGLKGSFFLEALLSGAIGSSRFREIVSAIQQYQQEVQLHLHSEWLEYMNDQSLGKYGYNIREFSEDQQYNLLSRGRDALLEAGVPRVDAFRAGNFGANRATLRALARAGIRMDSSYNICALATDCALGDIDPPLQPCCLEGVLEFPQTCFQDWPGHYRAAQLCACSAAELEYILLQAWASRWHSFVILTHSFELLRKYRMPSEPCRRSNTILRRFRQLCRFLAVNKDKFQTHHFKDLAGQRLPEMPTSRPLRSKLRLTMARYAEQMLSRIY